jgi:hypothetical protein
MRHEFDGDRRGADARSHELAALVTQHADQFGGGRFIEDRNHIFAARSAGEHHGARPGGLTDTPVQVLVSASGDRFDDRTFSAKAFMSNSSG